MSGAPARTGTGSRRSAGARQTAKSRAKRPKEPQRSAEPVTQVTIKMRESLHKDLTRKAFNSGMTMRGYIMRALKQAGLGVTETDLIDGRKRSSGR